MRLRYVDPMPPRGRLYRTYARVALWLSRHVGWKIDPLLIRLSGGRLGLGLMVPTALLETRRRVPNAHPVSRRGTGVAATDMPGSNPARFLDVKPWSGSAEACRRLQHDGQRGSDDCDHSAHNPRYVKLTTVPR
jgi:hypothetical protein